jgi:hypothetical protein
LSILGQKNLFTEFRNLLITLLKEYKVPIDELDMDETTSDLYSGYLLALQNVEELLAPKNYISFKEKFMNHPQIRNIWKENKVGPTDARKDDPFIQFRNELKSLWKEYDLPDDLDFINIAEQLFSQSTETSALQEIQHNVAPKKFKAFQTSFMNNKKLIEYRTAAKAKQGKTHYI